MKQFALVFVAALLPVSGSGALIAQEGGPAHAPDGRAQQLISPLYFAPRPNAPFTATARTLWVRTLPDGSTVTHENSRLVTRDAEGRIFQERVTFVPVPNIEKRESWVHATDYDDPSTIPRITATPVPRSAISSTTTRPQPNPWFRPDCSPTKPPS